MWLISTCAKRIFFPDILTPALILYSGGMNGYITLCSGDPCPPIFRSPVDGLEDIMDNQVM